MTNYNLDVNECASNNGGCSHTCNNTDGSFVCSCDNGYRLDNDELGCLGMKFTDLMVRYSNYVVYWLIVTVCVVYYIITTDTLDINECNTNNGGCSHSCTNTEGSYYCSCDEGYVLDANDHACNGKTD